MIFDRDLADLRDRLADLAQIVDRADRENGHRRCAQICNAIWEARLAIVDAELLVQRLQRARQRAIQPRRTRSSSPTSDPRPLTPRVER